MSNCKKTMNGVFLFAIAAALSACGGGGGGGGGGGTVSPSALAPVTVSSANAPTVVGDAFEATDDITDSGGALGVFAASAGSTRSTNVNVIDTIIKQIERAPDLFGDNTGSVSPAAVVSFSEPCDSGTINGNFNDADNSQELSTGDTLSISANNCSFDGVVMNGSFSVDNVVVTGGFVNDVAPYSFGFRMRVNSFSATLGGETVLMNGDGTISESTQDGVIFTSTFSGNGLEIVTSVDSLILTDYLIEEITDQSTFPFAYTLSINGTVSSTSAGGSVTITTIVAFTGTGESDPTGGEAVCVGEGNTSVTLIANSDGSSVQLLVDNDGDGNNDDTLADTWVAL